MGDGSANIAPTHRYTGAVPILTLADLQAENSDLLLTCRGCARINTMTPHALAGRVFVPGDVLPALPIADVLARLRCSRCGSREAEWTVLRRG